MKKTIKLDVSEKTYVIGNQTSEQASRISDVVVLDVPDGAEALQDEVGHALVLPVQPPELLQHLLRGGPDERKT